MAKAFKFNKKQISNWEKSIQNEVRKRVKESTKEVIDFYLDEVSKFYNEYQPVVYSRHPFSTIEESGMAKTFSPIYKEKKERKVFTVYGGISLNTYHMYTDYNGQNDWVLWSFTQGYHGLPEPYETYRGKLRPIIDTRKFIEEKISEKLRRKIDLKSIIK